MGVTNHLLTGTILQVVVNTRFIRPAISWGLGVALGGLKSLYNSHGFTISQQKRIMRLWGSGFLSVKETCQQKARKKKHVKKIDLLGSGFMLVANISYVRPDPWGNDPI